MRGEEGPGGLPALVIRRFPQHLSAGCSAPPPQLVPPASAALGFKLHTRSKFGRVQPRERRQTRRSSRRRNELTEVAGTAAARLLPAAAAASSCSRAGCSKPAAERCVRPEERVCSLPLKAQWGHACQGRDVPLMWWQKGARFLPRDAQTLAWFSCPSASLPGKGCRNNLGCFVSVARYNLICPLLINPTGC